MIMGSFGPHSYITGIKKLAPADSKFKKESITLIASIIYDINSTFVNACLQNDNGFGDITVKHIKESIKNAIPEELQIYAFAEANKEIVKYNSGLIDYKGPNIPREREIGLNSRILRESLEEIAWVVNNDMTLSKDSTALVNIMQKLARQMADKCVETIGDKAEMSLGDMKTAVRDILGEELFQHSEGHAESNLEWYRSDDLDFNIKPLVTEGEETVLQNEINIWGKYVQKNLKSKNFPPISKEVVHNFEKIVNDLTIRILEETKLVFQNEIDNVPKEPISEKHVAQAIRNFLSEPLYEHALCNADGILLKYKCGLIKYDYGRKEKDESTTAVERDYTTVVLDFQKGVKHILRMANCHSSRGFPSFMDDLMNDVFSMIVEKSCESARENGNIISGNDIIVAINGLLPIQLRRLAFARIAQMQLELGQPWFQLPRHVSSNGIQPAEGRYKDQPKAPTDSDSELREGNGEISEYEDSVPSNGNQLTEVRNEEPSILRTDDDSKSVVLDIVSSTISEIEKDRVPMDVDGELDIPQNTYWLDVRPYEFC